MAASTTGQAASSLDCGTMRLCIGLLMLFAVLAGQGAISFARLGSPFPAWLKPLQAAQPAAATLPKSSHITADLSLAAG